MKKIKDIISSAASGLTIEEQQYPTVCVSPEQLRKVAQKLKSEGFDVLLNLTGMDYNDKFGVIYHLTSTVDKMLNWRSFPMQKGLPFLNFW